MSEKRKGRPTSTEHIEIKNNIQKYYLQEVDPTTTKILTGHNSKTIRKYFGQWDEEIHKSNDESFLEKAKERKQKAIMRFNYQISKLDKISSILEDKMEQSDGPMSKEFGQNVKLWQENEKMITALTLHIVNIENSPTADVSLDQKVEEYVKKTW